MIVSLFGGPGGAPDECWTDVGTDNGKGYRTVRLANKNTYVHRLSYECHVGPIPDGLVIDHLCRNRACWNPRHLEAVTNAENILRGESPPARNRRKEACSYCGGAYKMQVDGTRRCSSCRFARRLITGELNGRGLPGERSHCPHGHPYDEETTYLVRRPDGSIKQRMCRECGRQRSRDRRARNRGEAA